MKMSDPFQGKAFSWKSSRFGSGNSSTAFLFIFLRTHSFLDFSPFLFPSLNIVKQNIVSLSTGIQQAETLFTFRINENKCSKPKPSLNGNFCVQWAETQRSSNWRSCWNSITLFIFNSCIKKNKNPVLSVIRNTGQNWEGVSLVVSK